MKYTACLLRADEKHPHLGAPGYQYFFKSVADADKYFSVQAAKKIEVEAFPVPDSVTLEIKPEDAYADPFTYIWFSGLEQKYSFGTYVTNYTPRNPNLTNFTLQFDPWASCAGLYQMNRCIVERNHLAYDPLTFNPQKFWEITLPNLPMEPAPIQPVFMHGPYDTTTATENPYIRSCHPRGTNTSNSILLDLKAKKGNSVWRQYMSQWPATSTSGRGGVLWVVYALSSYYDSTTDTPSELNSEPIVAFFRVIMSYQANPGDIEDVFYLDASKEGTTDNPYHRSVDSPSAGWGGTSHPHPTVQKPIIYLSDLLRAVASGKALLRRTGDGNIPLRFQTDKPEHILWVSGIQTPYRSFEPPYWSSNNAIKVVFWGRGSTTSAGQLQEGFFWSSKTHWENQDTAYATTPIGRPQPALMYTEPYVIRAVKLDSNETPTQAATKFKNKRFIYLYMNQPHDVSTIIRPMANTYGSATQLINPGGDLMVGLQHRIFVSPMGIRHIISEGGGYSQYPTANYYPAEKALDRTIEFMHPNLSTMAQRDWASSGVQTAQQALQIGGGIVSGLTTILANRKDGASNLGTAADLASLASGSVLSAMAMEEANRGDPHVVSAGLSVAEMFGDMGRPHLWKYADRSSFDYLLNITPLQGPELLELTPTNLDAITEIYDRFGIPIGQMADPNIVPQSIALQSTTDNARKGTYLKIGGAGCVYGVPRDICQLMDAELQNGIYFIEPENQ